MCALPTLVRPKIDWRSGLGPWLVLGLVVLWAAFAVAKYGNLVAMGSDESGYLNNARLLRTGALVGEVRPVAGLPLEALDRGVYQPLGFGTANDLSREVPNYPMGYPLAVAAVQLVTGEARGAWWLAVGMAIALPVAVYRLGRDMGLERVWAGLAAGAVGLSPVTMIWLMRPMSDVFSTLLAVTAMIAAERARSGRSRWAVVTGWLVGWALLTRVPNVLLLVPIGLAWGWASWRRWSLMALGALPMVGLWMGLNVKLYGAPIATGYTHLGVLFQAQYVVPTLAHFAKWTLMVLTPLLPLAFGLSLLRWRGATAEERRRLRVWWGWILPWVAFYASYQFSSEYWGYLRFLLPGLPAVAIGGAWVLQGAGQVLERRGRAGLRLVCTALVLTGCGVWLKRANRAWVAYARPETNDFSQLADWVKASTNPDDVLVCMLTSGSLYYYSPNPIAYAQYLWPEGWARVRAATAERGEEVYATLAEFEYEDAEALAAHLPGEWEPLRAFGGIRVYRLKR